MEHRPSPHLPEYSPDNERAAQLEKDRQYLLFLLANDLNYDTHDVAISGNTEPEDSSTEAAMNSSRYLVTIPPHKKRQQPGRTVAIYLDITLVLDTQAVQHSSAALNSLYRLRAAQRRSCSPLSNKTQPAA